MQLPIAFASPPCEQESQTRTWPASANTRFMPYTYPPWGRGQAEKHRCEPSPRPPGARVPASACPHPAAPIAVSSPNARQSPESRPIPAF